MNTRHVYLLTSLEHARTAVAAARRAGVADEHLSLVARSDIQLESLPPDKQSGDTDFAPAAMQGAAIGGATGLVAGLIAVAIPPIGMTLAGAAALAAFGALTGTWSSAMMGAALPDPVRRQFEDEIAAGNILLVIDGESPELAAAAMAMDEVGAKTMPFEQTTALS